MDNNNLSNVPVSELAQQVNAQSQANPAAPNVSPQTKPKNKKGLIFTIIGISLLVGVGVALFFILRKPAEETSNQSQEEVVEPNVVWQAPEDSLEPSNDYLVHHQEIIDNENASFDERLESKLSVANLYSVSGMYSEAESILDGIDRTELTSRQLFQVYSAYAYLYQHSGDETKYNAYNALVEEELGKYWDEEEAEE